MTQAADIHLNPRYSPIGGRIGPWLGALLCAHALFQAWLKIETGSPWQLLWFCHVGLAIAGIGLIMRSGLLLSSSLMLTLMLHVVWLSDFATRFITGQFLLGAAAYLAQADLWAWLGTSYHFFTMPILVTIAWRWRVYDGTAVPLTMALMLILTVACRAFTPPPLNINRVFGIDALAGTDLSWVNTLPGPIYLPLLNIVAWLVIIAPPALVLRWRATKPVPPTLEAETLAVDPLAISPPSQHRSGRRGDAKSPYAAAVTPERAGRATP